MADRPMPAAFIGHGSPMNTIEHNRFTEAWDRFGTEVRRPTAVLCVSAHWYLRRTAVTAMARPRTIHDFGGFPALARVRYPAPGAPDVAAEVARLLAPIDVELDQRWGLDHGTWSVLAHVFPKADVPVVQLALDARRPYEWHLDVGARLAPLREQGVLVVGSGNVVHHLGRIDWGRPEGGTDWARRFDDAARTAMTTDPATVVALRNHRDHASAVPSPDHFLPLLYVAGLAVAAGTTADVLVQGYAFGSLSMTSYTVGH